GFSAETVPSTNPAHGSHLILTRPPQPGPTIALVSHLDTVFPAAEEIANDFRWRVAGPRIFGPGTVDIKGGTVLIYMLLDAIRSQQPDAFAAVNWQVLFNAAEEVDSEDFAEVARARIPADARACLVFEGGFRQDEQLTAVVARKGMGRYRIIANGRAAHAGSNHPQGANAIVQMAEVVQRLSRITDYDRDLTVNVGHIQGGTVSNRVPHEASIEVEMRAFSPAVFAEAHAAILALDGLATVRSAANGYACRVRVEPLRQTAPWPRNPATDRLLGVWQTAAAQLGYALAPEERGGLSDGNYLWPHVPTLDGLGPAGGNAHCSERSPDGSKEQEYCRVDSFVPRTMVNVTAVLSLIAAAV
ncbi:MAG: M20/M25/M40 family metallo-hydrolase, partial [Anaerolineales bacterium]|nr:M20/M25/M40 family metallo-hydrolase [Anaerolineales bacterium]